LGKLMLQSKLDIFSINVCDDADFFRKKIEHIFHNFEQQYKQNVKLDTSNILIYDGYVGAGYGAISDREIQLIKKFARTEGIVLDPVYTAKAFLGLEDLIKKKKLRYKNVLFIHTGGIFGVFPMAEQFMPSFD